MKVNDIITESASAEQLTEEFDLIESIINRLAEHNGVDAEEIWEDLETLTEDELYAFAVTSEPIMESQDVAEGGEKNRQWSNKDMERLRRAETELDDIFGTPDDTWTKTKQSQIKNRIKTRPMAGPKGRLPEQGVAESEAWQKANNRDKTDGMSRKAVNTYRREHPGSKLQTAVTTKPSKLKKGSKASKRRKSYCSRSRGQMKMHSISCSKTPDKAICKARRRWNC
jgi:FPC/CPF motif-containing protein YcgG